ncbi:MAG: GerW family sporulation protein [Anaerolineae bacterium]
MEVIKPLIEKLESIPEQVNVDAVFGEPKVVEGHVLIPVAEVTYGFGLGAGTAVSGGEAPGEPTSSEPESLESEEEKAPALGAGGGAGARARPIAYIEVGPEGTRVRPIENEQKIALAGILLSAWAVGWLGLVLKTLFSPRK